MATLHLASRRVPQSDAFELLVRDHKRQHRLFVEYQKLVDRGGNHAIKSALVADLCVTLTVHSLLEEELLYPAARTLSSNAQVMDEAEAGHVKVRGLISRLQVLQPSNKDYDATVSALAQEVAQLAAFEEGTLFPEAKAAGLDSRELGQEIELRRQQFELPGADSYELDATG